MGGKVIAIYCVPGTERSKLLQRLFEEESLNLKSTITTTSRKPRIGERDGLNYHFITAEEFKKRIQEGKFVEYEEACPDILYGTDIRELESSDKNYLLEISPENIGHIKQQLRLSVLTIFVGTDNFEKLRESWTVRGTSAYDEIESRIKKIKSDMKYARQFDLVITNPLDGSTKYLEEVLDAAHDFLFSDNSVILSEEDEGIDVIGKVILRIKELSQINNEREYLFRGVTALHGCKDTRERYGSDITSYTHTISSGYLIRLVKENNLKDEIAISYIKSLLMEARRQFPSLYVGSDLEVLSDIQHNGGATCLIDFSKNILTSLWFACQDDFDKTGFLYILDVQEELKKGTLIEIKHDDARPIDVLLSELGNKDSNEKMSRFYLWYPKAINNRIVRQDSVFIFGLQTMVADDHAIKVIPIHKNAKRKIRDALERYFNISELTIYNDPIGFAMANAKLKPIRKIQKIDN